MTTNEWARYCQDMNDAFAGGLPPGRADAIWKYVARDLSPEQFDVILRSLLASSTYAPTIKEFIDAAKIVAGGATLPWPDVWAVCAAAAPECGKGMANARAVAYAASQGVDTTGVVPRNVLEDEPGNTTGEALAVAVVRARLGETAAQWFATYGRAAILSPSARFGDDNWGTQAIRVLGESYAEYVAAEPVRQARATLNAPAPRPALGA